MLGIFLKEGIVIFVLVLVATATGGCVRNVKQHAHSGSDFRIKGAKEIKLTDNEGKVRDIVTYPGGDRVDWKFVELTEPGILRFKLKYKPARPNHDLAFRVFGPYRDKIGAAKPSPRRRKRSKSVKLFADEPGKYYVQVYAPRRMDAGEYRLYVRFKPRAKAKVVDLAALTADIPGPPTLPAIPDKPATTTSEVPSEPEPDPEPTATAIKARIVNVQLSSSGQVIVTLNRGQSRGIERGWSGNILKGSSGEAPLTGGQFRVVRVTRHRSVARVSLSVDQISANRRVLLTPPTP